MNVYRNEEDREKYLQKYFTKEGAKALETRLKFLAKEYVEDKTYPISLNMLGFVELIIPNKEHHEGMMENLRQVLGLKHIEIKGEK